MKFDGIKPWAEKSSLDHHMLVALKTMSTEG